MKICNELCADSSGKSHKKISGQIIGGTAANQKQFPWQVYMDVDNSWLCGGSLIVADWVLTAAHCVFEWVFKNKAVL
jgi:secreted trypsin-like serine protease